MDGAIFAVWKPKALHAMKNIDRLPIMRILALITTFFLYSCAGPNNSYVCTQVEGFRKDPSSLKLTNNKATFNVFEYKFCKSYGNVKVFSDNCNKDTSYSDLNFDEITKELVSRHYSSKDNEDMNFHYSCKKID
jgi:hypothetical protein